ncbi:MAG: phenylalanine--tRNA ligase subunit alpha, partial [Candidatus Sungbacteria bacterium]|nr:phenylalanine--tRNA ligase subunit alpha [Candidatus Sungbacteria bacterium]
MAHEIKKIEESAKAEIPAAQNREELEELRIKFLGREKGALTLILRGLKALPEDERKHIGEEANKLRTALETLFHGRGEELKKTDMESVLK